MITTTTSAHEPLARIATGVPGLDEILRGGFFEGAVYIVRGTPGAGKTILANQICFHQAREGRRALFVTLLAENHTRMLQHLERMAFFDASAIPKHVYYVSAFRVLEENGLKGLMELLRREMRAHQASILVLDGLIAVEETSATDREFRKFIHELQAHAALEGCCTLLLTNGRRGDYNPEHTMVDGLVTLEDVAYGKRRQREFEVHKFRGSASLRGRHSFQITDSGILVHPRPESRFQRNDVHSTEKRVSLGFAGLDTMFDGGVLADTVTLLLGASGTGKTTLGAAFLSQSSKAEPGVHFGFYENPEQLIANTRRVGIDLKKRVDAGHLELYWTSPVERILDSLGNRMMDAVVKHKAKRLFIDGWGAFLAAAEAPERVPPFFTALANEMRSLGTTIVCAVETENLVGPDVQIPVQGTSAITENIVLLRFTEYQARLYRLISILKSRGGGFDPLMRELVIGKDGLSLADSFHGVEQLLTGSGVSPGKPSSARTRSASRAKPRRRG